MLPLPPLTAEQRAVVERAPALSRDRLASRAARYDAESAFPYENYADLHAAGLHALTVPREHGGVGADPVTYVHALREIARGRPATALTFNRHSTVTTFLTALATDERKRRWLGEIVERWHHDALAGPVMPPSNDRCLETAGRLLCGLPAATLAFQ
jgi:alkylation response protein AidB-like acyl-CoA dehydrogenase